MLKSHEKIGKEFLGSVHENRKYLYSSTHEKTGKILCQDMVENDIMAVVMSRPHQ